jgi:hypothetical protein
MADKCETCRGTGRVKLVPPAAMKEGLRSEIIRQYPQGEEREAWLKTLEGVPGKCPDCKGKGVTP